MDTPVILCNYITNLDDVHTIKCRRRAKWAITNELSQDRPTTYYCALHIDNTVNRIAQAQSMLALMKPPTQPRDSAGSDPAIPHQP